MVDEDDDPELNELPDGGLPMTARQEQFSVGFVRMVVAAAGCAIKSHDTDYDGVDITITSSTDYRKYLGAEIEFQLKCTTQTNLLKPDYMAWKLHRDPFLKLTHPKRYLDGFLGVLLVPRDEDLLQMSEDQLLTNSRMYWQHASRLGEIADGAETKKVRLPRSNLFDVEALKGIMQRVGDGGVW